jgi:acyl-CoA reductase-like NAD-dependent aldehyde dehydrogenase
VHKAEAHVAAVEKYPKLIDEPQSTAIKAAAALDELPEPERQEVLAQPEPAKAAVEAIKELPSVQQANLLKQWAAEVSKTRDGLMLLPLDEVVPLLDQDKTESARRFRADLRNWTDRLEARLSKASQLHVVGGSS